MMQSLRRSLFFVPGGEPRKLEKAVRAEADTLLLDLEDAVAPGDKSRAREQVASFLRAGDFGGAEPAVRVNPPGTPYFDEDLEAAVGSGARAVMIPKSERAEDLQRIDAWLLALEERAGVGADQRVRILALAETAAGIADARWLPGASPRIDALCFGHADFSRDMGLPTADASRGVLHHARCTLAIVARAGRVVPIDTVFLDVRDEAGFREDAALGRSLGFEGKLCIHPRQVPIANEIFTPSKEEIDFALRVVEASRQAEAEGKGVFTVDGKMVDAPLVAAQQRTLERARRAGALPGQEDGDGR